MSRSVAVFLCDLTGVMAQPWLEAGYDCILIDPQHPEGITTVQPQEPHWGTLTKVGHIIDHPVSWKVLRAAIQIHRVVFVAGFPVCTQLAVSGTARWAEKAAKDKHFQAKAMELVHECRVIGQLSGAPWFFENPVSSISSIYRKPDYTFQPYEYGGYLPDNDNHPLYPEYFPPLDAYGKKTCLWTGNGFVMPDKRPVTMAADQLDGQGQSKAHNKLGGKSDKTKNIRSATPRGFAQAVFEANAPHLKAKETTNDNQEPSGDTNLQVALDLGGEK